MEHDTKVCRFTQDGTPRIGMLQINERTLEIYCITYKPEDEDHRFVHIMNADKEIPDNIQDIDFHVVTDYELLGLTPDGQGTPDLDRINRFRKANAILKNAGGDMLKDPKIFDQVFGLLYAPELTTGLWKDIR